MDIASVRGEIKSWERAFKADNSRDATVDDIKAHPSIAAKYKLYKKLSKEAASSALKSSNTSIPSTPPRRSSILPGPSSLVPKSRATHSSTDATSSNPFSPAKSPRKKYISPNEAPMGMPNFMKEPTTPPSKKRAYSTPSPELFAPIEHSPKSDTSVGNTAVKKARKRLRGDIVSPSPKKPRMVSRTNSGLHEGSDAAEDDDEAEETYIDESPVKQNLNGKDFKLLFEERLPTLDFSGKKGPFSGTQSVFNASDKRPKDALHLFTETKADEVRKPLEQSRSKVLPTLKKTEKSKAPTMKSISSGKQPFTPLQSTPESTSSVIANSDFQNDVAPPTTRKRSSSEDVDEPAANQQSISNVNGGLLPPSPPPSGTTQSNNRSGATKGQTKNRKKAKLLANNNLDEDSMEDEQDLQIVDYKPQSKRRTRHRDGDEEEEDMSREVLGIASIDRFGDVPEEGKEEIDGAEPDINLPENLRRVLYISSSQARVREERALVDSLLQGGPGSQSQRGEVWGIGEVEDAAAAITDGEDDWAGEGVPWEVGEL